VVEQDLQLTNIHGKLARRGVIVPYRTLHRFAVERCGFGRTRSTVRVADAQHRVQAWCATTAGLRVHGTTAQRPAEHFAADERHQLLPVPAIPYDVPVFATPKVAPDRHVEVLRALYSVPGELIGQRVEARADSRLVQDLLPGSADQDPSAQAARRPLDRPHRLPGRPGRLRAARRASVDKEVGPGWRLDRRGHSDARLVTDLK
jgi:hypothetical protein